MALISDPNQQQSIIGPPLGSGNPVLDEIDQAHQSLSPPAKQAISLVASQAQPLVGGASLQTPQGGGASMQAQPIGSPMSSRGLGGPSNTPLVRMAAPPNPSTGPDQAELARITKPPLPGSDPNAHTKADTGVSGIDQIHSPLARIPLKIGDALLSTFLPGLAMSLPGTQLHHQALVKEREGILNQDEARQTQEANQNKAGAETEEAGKRGTLAEAQTDEAKARAESLRNPVDKTAEGRTVTVGGRVKQYNPKTGTYDIDLGDAKEAGHEGLEKDADGNVTGWLDATGKLHSLDDAPPAIKAIAAATKPKTPPEKEPNEYADFKADYAKTHKDATAAEIQAAFAKNKALPKEPPDHGVDYIDPETRKLVHAEPGGVIPKGAQSLAGVSGEATKESESNAAAEKARTDAQHEYQLAQQLAANPSPTNDVALLMRYIGATKPDSLGKLRLNNNEVNLVLGTRSTFGDLEALVQKVSNGEKLTPKQRQDMLGSMKLLTGAQGGAQGAWHQIKIGDKVYQYKGSGATDDMANYTEVKK